MQDLSLKDLKYVVFDIETTGLYADQGDEIVELGAVMVENLELGQTFQTMVNPRRPIPASATRISGIRDADVSSAPDISLALPRFLDFVGSRIWVAQNARFDLSFIVLKMKQLGLPLRQMVVVDTMGLSKMIFPYESSHSLDKIMARLGITRSGDRHRSLDDSRYTAQALIEFVKLLGQQRVTSLPQIEAAFIKPESLFKVEKTKSRSLF